MAMIKGQREKLNGDGDNGGDGALSIRVLQRLNARRQR
jgi:NAD(P)H-hydrate repair Nnr-like enzyme with NAD(P)H-hydrate epimerase domain